MAIKWWRGGILKNISFFAGLILIAVFPCQVAAEKSFNPIPGTRPLEDYYYGSNWYISKTSIDCTAVTIPSKGVTFQMVAFPSKNGISFFYDNPNLKIEEKRLYSLRVEFSKNAKRVASWPAQYAEASFSAGRPPIPGFGWIMHGFGALDDVARNEEMELFVNDIAIGHVSLAGSSQMVSALRRCMAELQR